jgi:hypothetical protein
MTENLGKRLVRSLNGNTIHKATCRWARPGRVKPWTWADTVTPRTLVAEVEGLGHRECKICEPLKEYR